MRRCGCPDVDESVWCEMMLDIDGGGLQNAAISRSELYPDLNWVRRCPSNTRFRLARSWTSSRRYPSGRDRAAGGPCVLMYVASPKRPLPTCDSHRDCR